MQRSILVLLVLALAASVAWASKGVRTASARPVPFVEQVPAGPEKEYPPYAGERRESLVGTPTTLEGWYDYQSNGGGVQQIRTDPATGYIHVTYMLSEDSSSVSDSRRTGYAYSTDAGLTWNNFSNVRVPARRSGFPTLDIGRGPIAGATIISNHAIVIGTNNTTIVLVDYPPGQGVFSELGSQGPPAGGEPIWPQVAAGSDGSIITHSTINSTTLTQVNYLQRTVDLISWSLWLNVPGPNGSGGRGPVASTASGKVGALVWSSDPSPRGLGLWESTNNGASWPTAPVEIYPPERIVGGETLGVWVGHDITYDASNNALIAMNTSRQSPTGFFYAGSRIEFWSQATGFVTAVPWDSSLYPSLMVAQSNHLALGYPALALSGSRIVLAYQAFLSDTSSIDTSTGRHFGDIFYVQSTNGGLTWSSPVNLTNTPQMDERYPSISKWNPDGYAYVTWQEDTRAGSHAFNDEAEKSLSRLMFYRIDLNATGAPGEKPSGPSEFRLGHNYPNPFNPSTTIRFRIAERSEVRLAVFNTLGQEVAVLASGTREPGEYAVDFSAGNLPSGVYYYTLRAGARSAARSMLLLK
ncbi:MAG: T9SS type A sorting domain-containing protein [Bacteroidota bacterium]